MAIRFKSSFTYEANESIVETWHLIKVIKCVILSLC